MNSGCYNIATSNNVKYYITNKERVESDQELITTLEIFNFDKLQVVEHSFKK